LTSSSPFEKPSPHHCLVKTKVGFQRIEMTGKKWEALLYQELENSKILPEEFDVQMMGSDVGVRDQTQAWRL
jgi:hypothetical protein